jgi:Derlin-2/3
MISFTTVPALTGLILAMCYTVTQDQRGMKATFYVITIPAQLTPYCMILINLFFPGGTLRMIVQIEGLIAAHLYDFLTRLWPEFGGGRNLIPTPAVLSRLVQTPNMLRRDYGTAFRARGGDGDAASGQSTGASTGPLPDSWRTRGKGQRLG